MKKLRAHHLLCLSRFNELGNSTWYNKEYKKNFKRVFKELKNNPNQKLLIKRACDDICKKCPYIKKNICNKPSKYKISHWIKVMDNKTLRILKIKPNTIHPANHLFRLVRGRITSKNLKNICKGCEYLKNCLKIKQTNFVK